jgi:uncharacterized protein YndB with AHSA1/START domain
MCNHWVANKEANMTLTAVTRTVTLEADPDRVWDHLADPDRLGDWFGGPAELDLRPGGLGRMELPDGDRSVLVTEVEPGVHLSWLWWREDGSTSAVDLTLCRAGELTELTIVEQAVLAAPAAGSASASARLAVRA